MHDLFGISSQTLQRHVFIYISENYNMLMKKSMIGNLLSLPILKERGFYGNKAAVVSVCR